MNEFSQTHDMYQKIITKFLVESWKETLNDGNKLDPLNIEICENFSSFLVKKLGGQLRFIRMMSSLDESENYRLAPGGKLSISKATLFSYAAQSNQLGMCQSEQSLKEVVSTSRVMSKYHVFNLVLINLLVLVELSKDFLDELTLNEYPEHMKCLIQLMGARLNFLCAKFGLNEVCTKLLNSDVRKSYSVYNNAPQLHETDGAGEKY